MFKKDHCLLGVVVGVLAFVATALVIVLFNYLLIIVGVVDNYFAIKELIPLSLLPNLHLMRNYFLKYKKEKSGKGVLLITFFIMGVFLFLHLKFHLI
jgi:hypothetical protein